MKSMEFSIVRARNSLPDFFEHQLNAKKTVVSGGARYSSCPACGQSSDQSVKVSVRNGKWHCFSCEQKGDVIDAAALFWGKSLAEAAKDLAGETALPCPAPRVVPAAEEAPVRDQVAINEMIALLIEKCRVCADGVAQYLQGRGIKPTVIREAVDRSVLIGMPTNPDEYLRLLLDVVGRDRLIAAGVWKKDSKAPGIIYRPLVSFSADRQGAEFRLIGKSERTTAKAIRYGKPTPFFWRGSPNVMIVEGVIDLLSAVELGSERSIIGLPGASNWHVSDPWVQRLKLRGHVLLATDDDKSGIQQAKKLAEFLSSENRPWRRHVLPEGIHDLNDMLQAMSS